MCGNDEEIKRYKQLRLIAEEEAGYEAHSSHRNKEAMREYTKETLIKEFRKIRDMGWVPNARRGNVGGIGNTIEDLLDIEENNLPIPNAAEWELKCQRTNTTSLITLFHMEPSPRAFKFVPQILLPLYGWPHQNAGGKHDLNEMSFRQTIHGLSRSNRGFKIVIDSANRKILVSFDASNVSKEHSEWLATVEERVGLGELDPQPYWGFDDLFHKAGTKLLNCFFVQAEVKKEGGREFYNYSKIFILERFSIDKFVSGLDQGFVLVDFDARTGHNHGTKFRLRQNMLPRLYESVTLV